MDLPDKSAQELGKSADGDEADGSQNQSEQTNSKQENYPPNQGEQASSKQENYLPNHSDILDAATAPASKGRVLNTSALDGLRAFAVFHIILGHHSIYTNWTNQKFEDWTKAGEDGDGFSDGFDLMGGVSMGLFYILSGFVLMVGYGNDDNKPKNCSCCDGCCDCCCTCCDAGCCNCFCTGAQTSAAVQGNFDSRKFYWKRFARLGPLWYFGNLLSVHLFFTNWWWTGGPIFFFSGLVLSLPPLGLNSWLQILPPAGHLWTISTMTFFYLMFPKLYYRVRRIDARKLRAFAMTCFGIQFGMMFVGGLAIAVIDVRRGYWFSRSWPPNRLPVFVMGLCAARQCQIEAADASMRQSCSSFACGVSKGWKATRLWVIFTFVVLVGIAEQLVLRTRFTRWIGELVLPACFYELIVVLAYPAHLVDPPSRVHKLLQARLLRWFADISLAVYVVHEALIRTFALAYRGSNTLENGEMPKDVDRRMTPWGAAIVFPLSVLLGWFLTHFFEKPMSNLILKRVL